MAHILIITDESPIDEHLLDTLASQGHQLFMAKRAQAPEHGPASYGAPNHSASPPEGHLEALASFPAENPNPNLRFTPDGIVAYANRGGADMLDQLRGLPGQPLPDAWRTLASEALASGQVRAIEVACGDRVFAVTLVPITAGGYINAYGHDITEHKAYAAALSEREERYRTLFDNMAQGVFYQRADGSIEDINAAALAMFGMTREQILAPTPADLDWRIVTEDGRPLLGHQHPTCVALQSGKAVRNMVVGVFNRRINELVWMDITAIPQFRAGEQRPHNVFVTMHDVTAQRRAEARDRAHAIRLAVLAEASRAFAEASLKYRALLDLIAQTTADLLGDLCVIYLLSDADDAAGTTTIYDNDPVTLALVRDYIAQAPLRAEHLSGSDDQLRLLAPQLIAEVDPAQLQTIMPQYRPLLEQLRIRSLIRVPLVVQMQLLGVLMLARHQPTRPAFDEGDLHLTQDLADRAALALTNARLFQQVQTELAERQRAEAALEAERAQLAERVEARTADLRIANAGLARAARLKDEFLATMSHELRTPLNAILGRTELLLEAIYGPVTSRQIASLRSIDTSGRHLLALINDILDLSKIEAGKLELQLTAVDVALVCRMSLHMVAESALMKQITLSSALDDQVAAIPADERRLKQILVNLLSNAVKFTSEGGKVGLDLTSDASRQTATFTVWDTGIGIDEAHRARLFQPFSQIDSGLNRQYTGTGLGLSLVLRLAQAHGGAVSLVSAPGKGSRFSVTLPWPATPAP
ncbi:MAG: GAF domain-containing protein, partial [Chloroflexales bacterium]|nr:GAF domain-containing protein [Chloroflexales bacterium]